MQRIIVTGAAGRIGGLAAKILSDSGNYEVVGTDKVRPSQFPGRRFLPCDLSESPAAVLDIVRGADAVLHIGAIPGPGGWPEPTTFHNNVMSTYNVLTAAEATGVRKIVFASTVFTLGYVADAEKFWPKYCPVDEDHPRSPFETYALSKVIGEEICSMISRRSDIPIVSLRIMNVVPDNAKGHLPFPTPKSRADLPFVLYPYVGLSDSARACVLALESETTGHEPVFIAAKDIRFNCPTEELLRRLAPPDFEIRRPMPGKTSVISIQKAKDLIGYEPHYSWQDEPDATG